METQYGYEIIGLKEEAKTLTSIEIPDFYNGKRVYTFHEAVFSGNTSIVEIYVGKNINNIKPNSFVGCSALKKLIMHEEIDPDKFTVYEGLFNGTSNCKVYVPEAKVQNYIHAYWWSHYGAYIEGY